MMPQTTNRDTMRVCEWTQDVSLCIHCGKLKRCPLTLFSLLFWSLFPRTHYRKNEGEYIVSIYPLWYD